MSKKLLVVIGGPTAVGKTSLAISLARHYNSEILSADSRQFYREMDIGTAKPTPEELSKVPHYFINSLNIDESYTVGDFERDALSLLHNLFQTKNPLFLSGGSGLYIRAVCEGLDEFPPVKPEVMDDLETMLAVKGIGSLQDELLEKDPVYFEQVDSKNPQRLLRALGVIRSSGKPFSFFRKKEAAPRPFDVIRLCLIRDRQELYERINDRVDKMMEEGLLEEALTLYPKRNYNALQTVGYKELFEHFDGNMTKEEAIARIKQNTRRYAKRQMTWFRNQGDWHFLDPGNSSEAITLIDQALNK